MVNNENIKICTAEWSQEKLRQKLDKIKPVPLAEKIVVACDNPEIKQKIKEWFTKRYRGIDIQQEADIVITIAEGWALEEVVEMCNVVSTYEMIYPTRLEFAKPIKEFNKARKEEPGYRKLEKKVGFKGKVKVNKGVARKWYV